MDNKNIVFIAKSIDGYIADKNGGIDWLNSTPNTNQIDMGFGKFMSSIDAIVMGRTTFEMVCSFDISWPYTVPVFVLSTTLKKVPEKYAKNVELIKGTLKKVLAKIHSKGFSKLYIDGGKTIQSFLKEDLIDEMTITTMPILLGGGFSLFGDLEKPLEFEHIESQVFLDAVVQDTYRRKKQNLS